MQPLVSKNTKQSETSNNPQEATTVRNIKTSDTKKIVHTNKQKNRIIDAIDNHRTRNSSKSPAHTIKSYKPERRQRHAIETKQEQGRRRPLDPPIETELQGLKTRSETPTTTTEREAAAATRSQIWDTRSKTSRMEARKNYHHSSADDG
jgi:hypothetical protein